MRIFPEQRIVRELLRAMGELVGIPPEQARWPERLSPAEVAERQRLVEEAADPALVALVHAAEKRLGFWCFPLTPYEKRAEVIAHLLDPANPRFHTEDVRFYILNFTREEADGGRSRPDSPLVHPSLRRAPVLMRCAV
jgi:hypothetical protein